MDQNKLAQAEHYEAEAKRLRKEAFDERPLPDHWRVGQKVRTLRFEDWAWDAGAILIIKEVRIEDANKKAHEYQVFWTGREGKPERFWTTPNDVELVEQG